MVAFRVVMLTASVLALVSALIASLTIPASAGKIVVARVEGIGNESVKTAVQWIEVPNMGRKPFIVSCPIHS